MALSILDGNQSATTLSTILSSGQHITAHTVVSLGTQAITDMRSAVSGSVVSISNFPATQPVSIASVTVGNSLTISSLPAISGTVTIGSALPTGTNRIGVVTIGAGTVTIGAGTAQIGSVTASNLDAVLDQYEVSAQEKSFAVVASLNGQGYVSDSAKSHITNSVTIGSLPAISGTVTANLSISSTAITSGGFSSLTSATLVPANPARKMATVFNLGAGQLFINAGVTATTLGGGFMVALSSGDFFECNYTTTTLSAIFATAGTASWVSH